MYGRVTGWGRHGPLAQRAGHDLNDVSITGTLSAVGRLGERPAVPLNLFGDFGDPHLEARGTLVKRDGFVQPAPSPRFSRTPATLPCPPPVPGGGASAVFADWT